MIELIRLVHQIQTHATSPATVGARLDRVAVIGGGFAGRRIAASCLAFARVFLIDPDAGARSAAARHVRRALRADVQAGVLSGVGLRRRMRRLHVLPAWPEGQSVRLVIECVPENLALKQAVLASVETHLSQGTVWATNSSALCVSAIASAARQPARVLGMHHLFQSERARLAELVVTPLTDARALEVVQTCAALRDMVVLHSRDVPGFFTTRVLTAYLTEALLLLEEGWSVAAIDRAAERFGFVTGPFHLLDRIGLDVAASVGANVTRGYDEHSVAPLRRLLDAGCLGRKSGSGFYLYDGRRTTAARVNPLARTAEASAPRCVGFDLRERLALAVVGEAARSCHRRIVGTPAEADIGAVLGVGFPAATGGPLRYAARRPAIVARMSVLARVCGSRYRPVPLLTALHPCTPVRP